MGDYQNLNQIGEEIKDALEDALNTLDFSGLNKTISDTVNGAIHEVRKQFGNVVAGNTERSPETERSAGSPEYRSKVKVPREIKAKQQAKETGLRVIRQRPVGQISSVLYTVFGGVGAGITGVCAIICGALAAAGISGFFIGLGISLPLLAVSVGMLGKGSVQRGRLERFRRYLKACGDKTYFAYTDDEKNKTLKKLEKKKYTVQRSKGLGENEPDMMWLTTMNPETRRLIKVTPAEAEATAAMFELFWGSDLENSRNFIVEKGHEYLDLAYIS